jgi:hypothetical protein
MKRLLILLLCLLIFLTIGYAAKIRKSAATSKSNEPFRTFELMDSNLSKLNRLQDELKRAINPDVTKATSTKPKSTSRPWTKASVSAGRTATSFRVLAVRQQRRYRSFHQPFGVRAFRALAKKAAVVQDSALRLSRTQDDALAAKQHAVFDQDSLALVLQYQAITGGYGALRCTAGERPCCEQKPSTATGSDKTISCKWICVASARACKKGFTGQRISAR